MTNVLSRRSFLRQSGWTAVGITIAADVSGCSLVPAFPSRNAPSEADAFTWLQLKPNGRFLFCSPRQEMGQGISSTLRLVVGQELGVPLSQIDVVGPDTSIIAPAKSTVGSESIKDFLAPTTQIARSMRALLYTRAAQQLGTTPSDLVLNGDRFKARDGAELSLAKLTGNAYLLLDPDEIAQIKSAKQEDRDLTHADGVPTANINDIVTGASLFAGDVQLPSMAYGAFVRAPQLGASLTTASFDTGQDEGVIATFFDGERAGLVAESPAALFDAIENVETSWELETPASQTAIDASLSLDEQVNQLEHSVIETDDQPQGPFDTDLQVAIPFAAHAAIEPRAAVARWNETGNNRLEIWTGTQDAFYVRDHVAKHFGLAAEDVTVYSQRIGGGFGGRTICTVELEAALLSQAAGRPVKVHWTRPDEFQEGFHRPPSLHHINARANDQGKLTDWSHGFKSGHVIFTSAAMPSWMQALTSVTSDPGTARGAKLPYLAERAEVAFSDIRMPVKTGPWRGLGAAPNNFAIETAIDQVASKKGLDPLDFRLSNLPAEHHRLSACITRVAETANWQGRAITTRTARGIACGIYKEMSYAAVIADVEIDPGSNSWRVLHLTCAHDCGRVINPDQVRAQIEGNLVWGIGMVKGEELMVSDGRLSADYLGDYQIPTIADTPDITIDLMEQDDTDPAGAGETAIVAAGAAIANAIASFTGRPISQLPIRL